MKDICTKPECGAIGFPRYSLGIYAGRYCDPHWEETSYRKEGREGFDPAYAGETYGDEDL